MKEHFIKIIKYIIEYDYIQAPEVEFSQKKIKNDLGNICELLILLI